MNREIIEGNKLIAEFMGMRCSNDDPPYMFRNDGINKQEYAGYSVWGEDLKYEISWDWLMPVVDKIENINHISVSISHTDDDEYNWQECKISNNDDLFIRSYAQKTEKIKVVYQAVVDFIKWHNKQNFIKIGGITNDTRI